MEAERKQAAAEKRLQSAKHQEEQLKEKEKLLATVSDPKCVHGQECINVTNKLFPHNE